MATLSVTISEKIKLNGSDRSVTNTVDITGVTQLNQRVVSVGTAEQSLILFDTNAAAGQFADGSVDYIRITNTDLTNFVTLRMTAADDEYFVKLPAGDSFVLFDTTIDANNDSGAATATLANLDSIKGQANTAACDVELFIAS